MHPPFKDDNDRLRAGALEADHRAGTRAAGDGWADPVPFTDRQVPPLPLAAVPGNVRRFVEASARMVSSPVEGFALLCLAAVGAACAKRILVEREHGGRRPETLNLYTMALGDPGERKSATAREVLAPFHERERELAEIDGPRVALETEERAQQEEERKHLRSLLVKGKGGATDAARVRELTEQLARPAPRARRLFTTEPTSGSLGRMLADNGERFAVMGAEGELFGNLAGRYDKGSAPPDLGLVLSAWDGEPVRSDRLTREPICLEAPALTMALFVQPQVLREARLIRGAEGKGFLQRFLFAVVKPAAHLAPFYGGHRDRAASDAWGALILGLLRELPEEAQTLKLSDAVLAPAVRFHDEVGREMAPGGSLSSATLKPFASKLRGQVERLIGILHMAEHGPAGATRAVSVETGARAVELARFFLAHGRAAFAEALVDPADALAVRIWEKVRRDRLRTCKPRELQRALDVSAEEIRAALAVLLDRNVVREEQATRKGATGRKPIAPVYIVNPKAHEVAPYGA